MAQEITYGVWVVTNQSISCMRKGTTQATRLLVLLFRLGWGKAVSLAGQNLETSINECGIGASWYVHPSCIWTRWKEKRVAPTTHSRYQWLHWSARASVRRTLSQAPVLPQTWLPTKVRGLPFLLPLTPFGMFLPYCSESCARSIMSF